MRIRVRSAAFRVLVALLLCQMPLRSQQRKPPAPAKPASQTSSGYSFRVLAKTGDVIDGRKLVSLNASAEAGERKGPDINDSGDAVFFALYEDAHGRTGSGIFTPKKFLYGTGSTLGGKTIVNVRAPVINNRGDIAFWFSFDRTGEAIGLNDRIVLHSGQTVDGLKLLRFGKPALNNNGDTLVPASTGDVRVTGGGLFKNGKLMQLPQMQAGSTAIQAGIDIASNDNGEIAFRALQRYVCASSSGCMEAPLIQGMRKMVMSTPLINNRGDFIYQLPNVLVGKNGQLFWNITGTYDLNDRGELVAISPTMEHGFAVIDYHTGNASPVITAAGYSSLARTLNAAESTIKPMPLMAPAINNRGQIVAVFSYASAAASVKNFAPGGDALVLASPSNMRTAAASNFRRMITQYKLLDCKTAEQLLNPKSTPSQPCP